MSSHPTPRKFQPRTNSLITSLLFALVAAMLFTSIGCGTSKSPDVVFVDTLQLGTETPKIDINTASKKQLMTLPGIGEIKARNIIEGRPYHQVDDLWRIDSIGRKTIAGIRDKITVN